MKRKWWTLFAVSVATFMLLLDILVVNVVLPSIREDLGASFTDLQWVIDAYALTLAALVLMAGSLADRPGRRRLFAAGLAIFTLASLACALAPDPTILILARAFQGVGGAIMFAVSLALIAQEFPGGRERGMAMGVYGATIGAAEVAGVSVRTLSKWLRRFRAEGDDRLLDRSSEATCYVALRLSTHLCCRQQSALPAPRMNGFRPTLAAHADSEAAATASHNVHAARRAPRPVRGRKRGSITSPPRPRRLPPLRMRGACWRAART
jgi:Major Facilitator Superfamily/leucine-zipper of insertion element IS481